jgi:hypothetical protein
MVRAFVLGLMAWCVEAALLVVAAAAVLAGAGPAPIDPGPTCPHAEDWRALGGNGELLPKFYASRAVDSVARTEACLTLAATDLPAASRGVARLGAAAAPTLFRALLDASPESRKHLDALLQAALPEAFPPREDDGSEEELPVERWLRIAKIEGPDLTPHEASLAVDRLVVNASDARASAVRRLGTVAVPELVRAMGTTRARRELALLTGLAHDATARGPVLSMTASASEVDAAVADWTKWLDDHRYDFTPYPRDRRIPWALRETRFARLLERAWASWTEGASKPTEGVNSGVAVLATAERAIAALVIGRLLLVAAGEAARRLGLPPFVALVLATAPGAIAAWGYRVGAVTASLPREALLLVAVASLVAAALFVPLQDDARQRLDPIARLTRRRTPLHVVLLLGSAAPFALLAVVTLETHANVGGLGGALSGEWLGPASLPAFTRVALLLPAIRFAVRLLRHVAGDERLASPGQSPTAAQ